MICRLIAGSARNTPSTSAHRPSPGGRSRRKKQEELAADNGGRVKSSKIDITYTPPPPCEVGGLCEHFARCRNEQIACLDYVRYEINGSNERTGAEPSKDYYD